MLALNASPEKAYRSQMIVSPERSVASMDELHGCQYVTYSKQRGTHASSQRFAENSRCIARSSSSLSDRRYASIIFPMGVVRSSQRDRVQSDAVWLAKDSREHSDGEHRREDDVSRRGPGRC